MKNELEKMVEKRIARPLKNNETIFTYKNEYNEWGYEVTEWDNNGMPRVTEEGVF